MLSDQSEHLFKPALKKGAFREIVTQGERLPVGAGGRRVLFRPAKQTGAGDFLGG